MYAAKSHKTSQSDETKKLIQKAKREIDKGVDWKIAIEPINAIPDTIQRQKAIKSIIEYI